MVLDSNQLITLAYRGLAQMQLGSGARIECTGGRIWVTEDATPGDVVLEPGDSYEITRGGSVLVQALRVARFSIKNAAVPQDSSRLPVRRVLVRRARLLAQLVHAAPLA